LWLREAHRLNGKTLAGDALKKIFCRGDCASLAVRNQEMGLSPVGGHQIGYQLPRHRQRPATGIALLRRRRASLAPNRKPGTSRIANITHAMMILPLN